MSGHIFSGASGYSIGSNGGGAGGGGGGGACSSYNAVKERSLLEMIHDRWGMGVRAKAIAEEKTYGYAFTICPALAVHAAKDTVYVFVCTKQGAVIIEDEACIFPSDKLMANLHLAVNA